MEPITKDFFDEFLSRLRHWNRGEGVKDHITADPIFVVEKKVRDYGFEEDYADKFTYIQADEEFEDLGEFYNCCDDDEQERIDRFSQDLTRCCFLGIGVISEQEEVLKCVYDDFYKVRYKERWERINFHFTKEGAETFIMRKKHDYPLGLRVFVDTQVYCWEYQEIIEGLLEGKIVFREDT